MSQLGTYLLLFGLAVSGYGLLAAAVGAKTGRPALVENARRCAFGLFATVVAANITMLVAADERLRDPLRRGQLRAGDPDLLQGAVTVGG